MNETIEALESVQRELNMHLSSCSRLDMSTYDKDVLQYMTGWKEGNQHSLGIALDLIEEEIDYRKNSLITDYEREIKIPV